MYFKHVFLRILFGVVRRPNGDVVRHDSDTFVDNCVDLLPKIEIRLASATELTIGEYRHPLP